MHEKLCIIDEKRILLGSANFTSESLTMHNNLIFEIYSPSFAKQLIKHFAELKPKSKASNPLTIDIASKSLTMYFLPSPVKGLKALLETISSAQSSLRIAMFTLTHPDIIQALIAAHDRGVQVEVAIDRYSYKGASSKACKLLLSHGIPLRVSIGSELFHHKWMIVDNQTLVMGSANWTKAAFRANFDYFFTLSPLSPKEEKVLYFIWKNILSETSLLGLDQ